MMKRCPVCGEMNPGNNRFCGNCGAELGTRVTGQDFVRGAEQIIYDLVKGAARTFFELRDQLEASKLGEQGRDTVDQVVSRLKDAVEEGRRDYEKRRRTDKERAYEIPVNGTTAGGPTGQRPPSATGTAGTRPPGATGGEPPWNPGTPPFTGPGSTSSTGGPSAPGSTAPPPGGPGYGEGTGGAGQGGRLGGDERGPGAGTGYDPYRP